MHESDRCVIGTRTTGLEIDAPVTLSRADRRRHLHVLGKTGTGKTTLLKALIFDDLRRGANFALLDPIGGLAEAVIDAVPVERTNEVICVNPADLERPVGFNPLHRVGLDQRHLVAEHVVQAFQHVWGATLQDAPRLTYVLYNGVRLLLEVEGTTLLGLPRLLIDDAYRTHLLKQCKDDVVAAYWHNEFARYDERFRTTVISPIQNKVGMLLAAPVLRNIIGQPRSTIDIGRLMNEGGILIANLAKGRIGATTAQLLGALLATTIAQTAEERVAIPFDERLDFCVYADEVHNVATDSFAGVLSEARNYKLMLATAGQFLRQLPEKVRHALIGNVGSLVAFRVGADDARQLAHEFDIKNDAALSDSSNFSAWARLLEHGTPGSAFVLRTRLAEPPARGRTRAVINQSRARHTRERKAVERIVTRQLLA